MPAPLSGIRIWLSGSIPTELNPAQADRIRNFALALARLSEGAQLVHGFHHSLTRLLLEEAQAYKAKTGRKAALSLFVSLHFEKDGSYDGLPLAGLRQDAELTEIPKAPTRDLSLKLLRDAMASQADVLIAIGGKWWTDAQDIAGVPEEFNLAIARGIPSFLLGRFGGATEGYLSAHPETLRNLRNGLDEEANQALASDKAKVETIARKVLDQIVRLPLGRRETSSGQRFRILCLDGGGIRGAFTAAVLTHWEAQSNRRIADHFDLIAGTSTGGILAIGLGIGMTPREILDFYKKEGPEIFPMTGMLSRVAHKFKQATGNKFDAQVLEDKLKLAYKDAKLANSPQRLLITSYNLTSNTLRLYRTSHHPDLRGHDHLPAVVVARATSAAPTYFKPAMVDDAIAVHEGVDGGVWANCPALPAIGEAVSGLKVPMQRIDLLSVGTACLPIFVESPAIGVGWAPQAADLFMNAQQDSAILLARQLLRDRFLRVDDTVPRIEALDDLSALPYLIDSGSQAADLHYARVADRFLNGVAAASWRTL